MSASRNSATKTFVYFVREDCGGPIKIGFSNDVYRRVKSLSTQAGRRMSLLAAMPGGRDEERRLHERFSGSRVLGEWFHPHAEILAEVRRVTEEYPLPKPERQRMLRFSFTAKEYDAFSKLVDDLAGDGPRPSDTEVLRWVVKEACERRGIPWGTFLPVERSTVA
jgi:hypothetical protein